MKYGRRIFFTDKQKSEIWDRWQRRESMSAIGRGFNRSSSSIYPLLARTGGIRPPDRVRSRLALTLIAREEISRGLRVKMWILADPPWEIDVVGGRLHHQSWAALKLLVVGRLLVGGLGAIKTAMVIGELPFSFGMLPMGTAFTKATIKDVIREKSGVQTVYYVA